MGKRTRGATLPVVGVLFIAGGFYAATAAAAPAIHVLDTTGGQGGQATFSVTLSTDGAQVAGTQNDIAFDSSTPVRISTTGYCAITTTTQCSNDNDCPDLPAPFVGKEPCIPPNGPACSVNADLPKTCSNNPTQTCTQNSECAPGSCNPKSGFFSFLPNGCTPSVLGNCTGIRGLVFAVGNLGAIPDGSTLYTCTVQVASDAALGDHPLTISNERAADPAQAPFNEACVDGHCAVTTTQACTTLADCPSIVTGTDGKIAVGPPGESYTVCDVVPFTGDNAGEFGDTPPAVDIFDVRAIFSAAQLGIDLPADGTARFSAMDSIDLDSPPTCGGDGTLDIFDVRQCFAVAQGLADVNYVRTGTGASCTSAVAPQ
jgi:hypothetical protein